MRYLQLPITSLSIVLLILVSACRKDEDFTSTIPCKTNCSCDSDTLSLAIIDGGQEFLYDSVGRLVYYNVPSSAPYGNFNAYVHWTYDGARLVNIVQGGFHGVSYAFDYSGDTAIVSYWYEMMPGSPVPEIYKLVVDDHGFARTYTWNSNLMGDSAYYHYSAGSLLPDSVVYYDEGLLRPEKLFYTSGMLTKAVLYDSDGAIFQTKEFFYDENERWIKYLKTGGYNDGLNHIEYAYNCCGQLTQSIRFSGEDTIGVLDYKQTGCGELINMNPVNYYRYPYMRLPSPF